MAQRTRNVLNNTAYYTEIIRSSVSALELGKALGLNPDGDGRCRCPVHGGRNKNLKLYTGDKGFYCFKCHVAGDSIKLVQEVTHCDFPEAIATINSMFHLGLDINAEPDQHVKARATINRQWRRHMEQLEKEEDRLLFEVYLDAVQAVDDAENAVEQFAPVFPDEEWDDEFVQALTVLPSLRECATCAALATIRKKE